MLVNAESGGPVRPALVDVEPHVFLRNRRRRSQTIRRHTIRARITPGTLRNMQRQHPRPCTKDNRQASSEPERGRSEARRFGGRARHERRRERAAARSGRTKSSARGPPADDGTAWFLSNRRLCHRLPEPKFRTFLYLRDDDRCSRCKSSRWTLDHPSSTCAGQIGLDELA